MSNKKVIYNCRLITPLFLIFLVLKLTKVITWSWWWITCPLWAPFAIIIGIVFFVFIGCYIAALFK